MHTHSQMQAVAAQVLGQRGSSRGTDHAAYMELVLHMTEEEWEGLHVEKPMRMRGAKALQGDSTWKEQEAWGPYVEASRRQDAEEDRSFAKARQDRDGNHHL